MFIDKTGSIFLPLPKERHVSIARKGFKISIGGSYKYFALDGASTGLISAAWRFHQFADLESNNLLR